MRLGRLTRTLARFLEKCLRNRRGLPGGPLPGLPRRLDRAVVHIGEVHDLEHVVTGVLEPAPQEILEEKRAEVADVRVVPDGGTAGVEGDARRRERHERLDGAGWRIE